MEPSARGSPPSSRGPQSARPQTARSGQSARSATSKNAEEYIISTQKVNDPDELPKLDTKMQSLEKDGQTVKMPSQTNVCALQLWEVYLAVAILCIQPHSDVLHFHIKALCEHDEDTQLCEAVLREHLTCYNVLDVTQETSFVSFFEEYMRRKFQLSFNRDNLMHYITDIMDDSYSGYNDIPRTFLLGPYVQAFLLQDRFFEGQYDEMVDAMRMYNLPVNDVLKDGEEEIGADTQAVNFDQARMYDDPSLILKKHGGWALGKPAPLLTKKDQLIMRLTGCTLDQLLAGRDVPDSPRTNILSPEGRLAATAESAEKEKAEDEDQEPADDGASEGSSHVSDYKVDPEHPKIVPFGLSLSEAYVLIRGLLIGMTARRQDWSGSVVGQRLTRHYRDGHMLCGAVLCDLYMREQIDVHHWTLQEGSIAVPYQLSRRRGLGEMDHYLDHYAPFAEAMFRDMRLPQSLSEAPIWDSLERKGLIDNHRPSGERKWGFSQRHVDVWDFARRDLLLDIREGYVTAARLLYDKSFGDPTQEEPNDMLMFCFLLQYAFDVSIEAINGFSRVMQTLCPPFQKGELFPPLSGVHAGAVCVGLMDRASRLARGKDTQLAVEAAEFNQVVMQRLEEKFFLSPKIFEAMDQDQSGELSMMEFVEGMRNIDMYKEFRHERVPEDVLRMIVADLAERLFQEVDVNGDGTLTVEEIGMAIRRRRAEALKQQEQRQWFRKQVTAFQKRMGMKKEEGSRKEAVQKAKAEEVAVKVKEHKRRLEWQAEVERVQPPDAEADIDTGISVSLTV